MPALTRDEATAFIEAMRVTLAGRIGFRWLVEKLSLLADYIDELDAENHSMRAFLDERDASAEYQAYVARRASD